MSLTIGVISDTHGILRDGAVSALKGSDIIIHAGDIGKEDILAQLSKLATVKVVRGNIDRDEWARGLPEKLYFNEGGKRFYLIHSLKDMDKMDNLLDVDIVICGHSHKPQIEVKKNILFINPGSAGPRRFKLPICVGKIEIKDEKIYPQIIYLE